MTKNKDQAVADTDNSKAPVSAQEKTSSVESLPAPAGNSGGKGLGIVAIFLSLLAMGGSGFTWFQTQVLNVQEESRLAVGVSEIGAQVTRLGDGINQLKKDQESVVSDAELENQLLGVTHTVEKAVSKITADQDALQNSMLELSAELERGVDQLLIEEVAQLLRMANHNVLFGNDVETAINALTLADAQLKGLKDPRLAAVRQTINAEVSALKTVERVDVESISARLRSLRERISSLPLENEPQQKNLEKTDEPTTQEELTFSGEMGKIWRDLIGSISIQRVDKPPKPLLVPEQRYFLNENIGLALSKAELALLQGQKGVYQASLASTRAWLMDYFDLENKQVSHVLSEIDALSAVELNVDYPNITGSYQALQSIVGGQ